MICAILEVRYALLNASGCNIAAAYGGPMLSIWLGQSMLIFKNLELLPKLGAAVFVLLNLNVGDFELLL